MGKIIKMQFDQKMLTELRIQKINAKALLWRTRYYTERTKNAMLGNPNITITWIIGAVFLSITAFFIGIILITKSI